MTESRRESVDWDPLSSLAIQNNESLFNPFVAVEEPLPTDTEVNISKEIQDVIEKPPVAKPSTPELPPTVPTGFQLFDDLKLAGEQVLGVMNNVTYISPTQESFEGILRITNFRVHFEPDERTVIENINWYFLDSQQFDMPHGTIERISRVAAIQTTFAGNRSKDSVTVYFQCKDMRKLQFRFVSIADASRIHDLSRMSAFPVTEGQGAKWLFAYHYGKSQPNASWNVAYDPMKEWIRQGVFDDQGASKHWRVSNINSHFAFSNSYPSSVVVPIATSDADLGVVAGFRSRARIPALTWYDKKTGGSIWRCSQPKVGIGSNFCREDEQLWNNVRTSTKSYVGRILDCRPFKSALGNKAKGFGYEDETRYEKTSIVFGNIQNIHTIRTSLDKLLGVVTAPASSSSGNASHGWLSSIEATGWLNHIRSILVASITVARYVSYNGFAVMVHCSDGWDRTAQVCALAQLMVDPYYRTIHGLQSLITKDFMSFGFQFQTRIGHGAEAGAEEQSPVFLQFMDCVWQLLNQFPAIFEFNEDLLLFIVDASFSCKYGNFLCDNEYERLQIGVTNSCVSLWDHIDKNLEQFRNSFYDPSRNTRVPVLPSKSCVARQVKLWDSFFLRFSSSPSLTKHAFKDLKPAYRRDLQDPVEEMKNALLLERARVRDLENQVMSLRSSITSMTFGNETN